MTTDDPATALESYIDSLAATLGLAIEPAWSDAVLANMRTIAQAADLVMAYPLADHDEAAPVFRA